MRALRAAARFKGYRLCRRPLQRLMTGGLQQLMNIGFGSPIEEKVSDLEGCYVANRYI